MCVYLSVPFKTNTQQSSVAIHLTTSSTGGTYTAFPDNKASSKAVVRELSTTMSQSVASSDGMASGMCWLLCRLKQNYAEATAS